MRREQEERRRASLKIQSLHRGRRTRKNLKSGAENALKRPCAGLKLLFDEADLDDNKAIDMDELRALIVDIPQRYSVDPDQIPTPEETDLVMAALDADGNGSIDYAEWEHWVLSNHFLRMKTGELCFFVEHARKVRQTDPIIRSHCN